MILTTPLFAELKKLYPSSQLTVLCSEINKAIALNDKSIDRVLIYKKNVIYDFFSLRKNLRRVDLWIDPKDSFSKTSLLLLKLFKPKLSIGFNCEKEIYSIDLKNYKTGNHAVDLSLSPVNYLSENKELNRIPVLEIPKAAGDKVRKSMKFDKANRRVLVNISAGNESRYISKDEWLRAIKLIYKFQKSQFVITGMSKDLLIINLLIKNATGIEMYYHQTKNIFELAELIRLCDIVISPDTSVIHICSAFNTPVIGMYPDVKWNLDKFAPLSEYNEVIVSDSKESLISITGDQIFEKFQLMDQKIAGGNAESRTRVRKEDH